ncbi:MAG TPA: SDR family oxidoreductase [Puia sp.]|jgi:NAD(P)-dependent dehydrogenase (short-subunit alcohol dehydrogenase family)|nr:SDR family oxidoreductase [Puia sp.]
MSAQSTSGSLNGQRIIFLGGSSGLGLATAKAAVSEGAQVVIVSSRLDSIRAALAELPEKSEGHVVDLTQEEQIKTFFHQAGSFDHLVFTAGETLLIGHLKDTAIDDAKKFFGLRFWGMVTAVKYAIPHLKPGGSIILTGGTASIRPFPGWSIGAGVLAAVEGFMRAMAVELAPIRVNMVTPGVVKTNLWSNMSETDRENFYHNIGQAMLLKRVGEPEDIARTYLYLLTQSWSTGQVIVVDGGATLV